jgi:hypothetical protein
MTNHWPHDLRELRECLADALITLDAVIYRREPSPTLLAALLEELPKVERVAGRGPPDDGTPSPGVPRHTGHTVLIRWQIRWHFSVYSACTIGIPSDDHARPPNPSTAPRARGVRAIRLAMVTLDIASPPAV